MVKDYLLSEEREHIARADTFETLSEIALSVLTRMPRPTAQVCGPISSGGTGSVTENLRVFARAIEELSSSGIYVFSQMPFETPMFRIKRTAYYRGRDHLLEGFYLPIFESGYISTLYFLRTWETSHGARWENREALRLGIEIKYL